MKLRIFSLVFSILYLNSAFADKAPTAADTLKRAQKAHQTKNRAEFIQAIGDVQRFIPMMSTKEELYPHVEILDELEVIAKELKLEELGNPLSEYAKLLARNAVKWVKVDTDGWKFQRTFFRWADDNARFAAANAQGKYLKTAKGKEEMMRWHNAILKSLELVVELKAEPFVVQEFEGLQGATARELLRLKDELSEQELSMMLRQTKSIPALQEVLTFLQAEVLKTTDAAHLNKILGWSVTIAANVKGLSGVVPFYVRSTPGVIVIEAVSKILASGNEPDPALADKIIASLLPNQMTDLGSLLVQQYHQQPLPEDQVEFLWELCSHLTKKYLEMGLAQKVKDLEKLTQRLAMVRVFQKGNFEGTYEVTVGKSRGKLTLVSVGSSNFILGLKVMSEDLKNFYQDYSLFDVAYNVKDDSYEAHHFAVDAPKYHFTPHESYFMKFRFKSEEKGYSISGVFSNGFGYKNISGQQVEKYETFPTEAKRKLENITGIYRGKFGENILELNLTQVGQKVEGFFTFQNRFANVNLNYGYFNPTRNVLWVTSGELPSYKWVQIRGQFSDDGNTFNGFYIIGGDGVKTRLELKRLE